MAVLRGAWAAGTLTHHGDRYHYDDLRVLPKPAQDHLDVWLGGIAPSELRRVGRLADGWLPSFVTPADAAAGKATVEAVAAEHGRAIDPEHYGVLIPYVMTALPEQLIAALAACRSGLADPAELVPLGWTALAAQIARFVDVGFSKFVVVPTEEPAAAPGWHGHLAEAADALLPLET